MSPPHRPSHVTVVGGSIAAVTAAGTLRQLGFDGQLTVVSDETERPYSRVPLSKAVLAGTQTPESARLPSLPDSIDLRLGSRAVALDPARRLVKLGNGDELPYDGLVIATGANARRIAGPGQRGELAIRTLQDSLQVGELAKSASSAIVVGAGFLGMEVASTLASLGLTVTVVDRDPPLVRLLGPWLGDFVTRAAKEWGVHFVRAPAGVSLLGDPVAGVRYGVEQTVVADLTVSAVGESPAVDWLAGSGLPLAGGGLAVHDFCRVAPAVVAAGDVTTSVIRPGVFSQRPHWTNAVEQARIAATNLLGGEAVTPYRSEAYYWTEQFGLNLKISGTLPWNGEPQVLDGDPALGSALLLWADDHSPSAAVAINYRVPVVKLKRLSAGGVARTIS